MSDCPLSHPTILIVEDEFIIRIMAEDYLQDLGFRTISARSVIEAIDYLECEPDIRYTFIDVSLDDQPMAGAELAATVRDRWPPMGIILTSARPLNTIPLPTRAVFIPKPYNLMQVADTFRTMAA